MPAFRVDQENRTRAALGVALALALPCMAEPALAQDKPTGAPLALSSIETEQPVPLAILLPDGKTAQCVEIRLHWNHKPDMGPDDDDASFTLDLPADNPGASIFTAQLWSASLASALAWQEPWQGARWKVLQTPVTDGSGLDAALAVGMIATSARRPYPDKTVVIGSLNPDGSLGPVSHLAERIEAAARAGMSRVIIPSVQRFDPDASGQVQNMVRHAGDLHLECVPVDNLVEATEATMNDPLPDSTFDSSTPKYRNEVATYIDDFAHREQKEMDSGLNFAPKEAELANYPPRLAAIWKGIYADFDAGQQAYRAGQVYVAYQIFSRSNGRMNGANALAGQNKLTFNVKEALAESDTLRDRLHTLMNPPAIDKGGLESAVLVAEMADWAYDIDASLEGAQLVTKQTFSQRSDATEAEKDRAREALLFATGQSKYLLGQADFYDGLLAHISNNNPLTVDENAAHLLPQLIPAQLATARSFTEGIRASDLRDGLLFDPRLVAYVNVLREAKADWDARQRKKENEAAALVPTPEATNSSPVTPDASAPTTGVGFNPGNTYAPPHTVLVPTGETRKLSDAAQCLIWVNHDCEIATLDEKYLRLNGTIDPATHEWHVKDRARLDELLQTAELGARQGIAFAEKAEIDSSVLAMIYERAAHLRLQGDDASALESLRNYWRCALLGNMCWQLAHTHKAEPVDLGSGPPAAGGNTTAKKDDASNAPHPASVSTNTVVVVNPPAATSTTNEIVTPIPPRAVTNSVVVVHPPVAPIATQVIVTPLAPPAHTNTVVVINPPSAPTAPGPPAPDVIPIAPIATNEVAIPSPPPVPPKPEIAVDPPVAPIATHEDLIPVARVATNEVAIPVAPIAPKQNEPPQPAPSGRDESTQNSITQTTPSAPPLSVIPTDGPNPMNIPVAPIAKVQDYVGGDAPPATNAAPVGPIPPSAKPDNADGHAGAFP